MVNSSAGGARQEATGDDVASGEGRLQRESTSAATEPTGPRRALIALYATFALAATARAVVQIATKFHEAPLAYLLSLLSGLIYIGATVGLTTRRPWSRGLAWISCSTEFVGVLAIGTLSIADAVAFPDDTVWSDYGSGYVYIPVVLPLLGLGWLWHTRQMTHPVTAAGAGAGRDRVRP